MAHPKEPDLRASAHRADAERKRAVAAGLFLLGLSACAGDPPPQIAVTGAEPERVASSPSFDLALLGRGFGLDALALSLDEGGGRRRAAPLEVILLGPRGLELRLPASSVAVTSPTRLGVAVRLERPVPPGLWGVRLLRGGEGIAEAEGLFEVFEAAAPDAGPPDMADAGPPDMTDAGANGADSGPADAGPVDASSGDTGPGDAGGRPFFERYAFRQPIEVPIAAPAPAGVTLRVPIPHAALLGQSRSRADAADLIVYQGSVPLRFQWEDARRIGTNDLVMVVELAAPLPARPAPGALVLYYGDPVAENAPTDAIYVFSQRFSSPPSPEGAGDPQAWFRAQSWSHCALDRSTDAPLPEGSPSGAYCVSDAISSRLVRQTLSTPVLSDLAPLPAGQVLEQRVWLAGRTIDGPADILYFSHGASNDRFDLTEELPSSAWSGLAPTAQLRFEDIDGDPRTVAGWRFRPDRVVWWREAVARFTIARAGGRSLHFRHVSTDDDASNQSFSAIDDWSIRIALDPDPVLTLGPVEARSF